MTAKSSNFPYAPLLSESNMGLNGNVVNQYATAGWMARDEFASTAPNVPHWFKPDLMGEQEEIRFFSWRYYYADCMLHLRGE